MLLGGDSGAQRPSKKAAGREKSEKRMAIMTKS
jgi:hypothetical protein